MINIVLVDDHELVREGLKKILARHPDMNVVGEASDSIGLFEQLSRTNPGVLILDITLPGKSGLEILEELTLRFPKVRTLVLTMHPEERFALRVLKAGASGYVTKDRAASQIVDAIRKIAGGGKYVSELLVEEMVSKVKDNPAKLPHEILSDREYDVFYRLASGKSTKQIAKELALSINTVATYKCRVCEKMKMKSQVALARYAMEHHLID